MGDPRLGGIGMVWRGLGKAFGCKSNCIIKESEREALSWRVEARGLERVDI